MNQRRRNTLIKHSSEYFGASDISLRYGHYLFETRLEIILKYFSKIQDITYTILNPLASVEIFSRNLNWVLKYLIYDPFQQIQKRINQIYIAESK